MLVVRERERNWVLVVMRERERKREIGVRGLKREINWGLKR